MQAALKPEVFRKLYRDFAAQNPKWNEIPSSAGNVYQWDANSTYIQEPPFFAEFSTAARRDPRDQRRARAGHLWRQRHDRSHFARRQHQEDLAGRQIPDRARRGGRGLQQLRLAPRQRPGDDARHLCQRAHQEPDGARRRRRGDAVLGAQRLRLRAGRDRCPIYDAAMAYQKEGTPLVVIAGQEYGTGSSRDWAAKGTALLGVKAVVAQSFERIHRSQPGRHGRAAAAIQGGHERADAEAGRHGDLRRPRAWRRTSSRSRT